MNRRFVLSTPASRDLGETLDPRSMTEPKWSEPSGLVTLARLSPPDSLANDPEPRIVHLTEACLGLYFVIRGMDR